jgi:hypothetical protein
MSNDGQSWLTLIAVKENPGIVWGRFDHQRPRFGNAELTIIIGATSLLIIVMLVSYWRSRRRKLEFLRNSSSQLFGELAAAHRLDRSKRRLIKRLAAAHGQRNSAALFVEPDYFEPTKVPTSEKISTDALRQLRHELFE